MSLGRRDLQEGFELMRQRRLEEAREFFQELLKLNPGDVGARFGLGCVYAAMGEKDRAVEEWRRCLELNPAMGEAHYALAWAYYDAGDYDTGFRHVEMAYRSGVPLKPLKELFNLFVKTGKPIAERGERPQEREAEPVKPTKDWILHIACSTALFILCYLLLRGTIYEGYPRDYLDATVAFYIAKIRILLSNGFRLYTPVWYFGYELLRFYPPLSTIIPYIAVRLTGNLLTTYYTLCLIYYALYVVGTYLFTSRFLSSPIAGVLAAVIWSVTHANVVSFQGHYWETARLMGTALIPWTLYFVERALAEGRKRYMVASIAVASYVLLSSMLSAIDLLILLIPFLLIRGGLAPHDPEPERYSIPERMGRLIIWGVEGLLGLTLWWYIPAILPHGIGVYFSVGKGRPPPLSHVLFQLHPPSWMTGIQLPITLLGLIGALLTIILQDRRGATPTIWFLSTTAIAYIIGLQGWRLILDIGFSLTLLSAYTIKTLEEQIEHTKREMGRWIALTLILLICGLLLYSYLPTYASYAVVDDTYRSTDEYLTATWLADHLNDSYRVYVMYGDHYGGTQWLNVFEPDVKQVLGGFDQGGRAMSLEPFEFDDIIKWGMNSTEAYIEARRHGVRYIVIDRRWMLHSSPDAYDKFGDKRLFRAVNSINDRLSYAEVYEVINATSIKDIEVKYVYWDVWRISGLVLSMGFTSIFIRSIIGRDKVAVKKNERIVKSHTVESRLISPLITRGSLSRILDILMYTITLGLILLIMFYTRAPIGFPKGFDAWAHVYKIKYILKFFPHFFWNYQWDIGVPIFGGTYPPMSYYLGALICFLTRVSPAASLNILATMSNLINILFLLAFLYTLTESRIISLIGISLLIFTPAYWYYWIAGGTYGRVISMISIGPSLYLTAQIYNKKRRSRMFIALLPLILALGISLHLIGGFISLFLVLVFILFHDGIIRGFIDSLKMFIVVASLVSFYITQYFFSNPVGRLLVRGTHYFPAKFVFLIKPVGMISMNSPTIPTLIISVIIYLILRIRRGYVRVDTSSLRGWIISSALLTLLFATYGYIGYLPFYPEDLYIDGFPPEHIFTVLSLGLAIFIPLILTLIKSRLRGGHLPIIGVLFLILIIAFGIVIEVPVMVRYTANTLEMPTMSFVILDEETLQQRLGTDVGGVAIWFNSRYLTPQTGGYYAQGVPYQDWCSWRNNAIWKFKGNDEETQFLLDWYAIRWIVLVKRDPEKFLARPDLYRFIDHRDINPTESWYFFEYLNASVILSATNAPPILFIGSDIYYDTFLRALSLTGLRSNLCIPVKGPSKYVDSYTLEELRQFPAIILYGYDYKDLNKMAQLLSQYVDEGGSLFMEANGSPDYKAEDLPDPFPVRETYTYIIMDEWGFNVSDHPISQGVNFTAFAPPYFGAGGWGVSTSYEISDWAEPILISEGRLLIVAGEYGKGRVVWSGMNLFYHAKSYGNEEEAKFISRILTWLKGVGGRDTLKHEVEFVNPQRRIVQLKERAGGILFKENYFKQWHAALERAGKLEKLRIYLAGPGLMYIPLPRDVEAGFKVVLWYELLPMEKLGYIMSITSLVALIIIAWRKPEWLIDMNRGQEILH